MAAWMVLKVVVLTVVWMAKKRDIKMVFWMDGLMIVWRVAMMAVLTVGK